MAADGDGGSGDVDHLGDIGAPTLGEEPAMALEDLHGVGQVEGRNLAGSFTPVVHRGGNRGASLPPGIGGGAAGAAGAVGAAGLLRMGRQQEMRNRVAQRLELLSDAGFYGPIIMAVLAGGEYDVERRLSEWHCTPEWYNNSNVSVVQPKPAAKEKLHKRDGIYSKEDIDLISTGISLQRGRIPAANIIQVDKWLKAASKQDKRALRVVNDGG